MRSLSHQICLIGCGPVGLTLANCLARSPYINSIALIDRKIPKISSTLNKIPNQRVYSINSPSLQIFNSLGVEKLIRQHGIMNQVQVISKQSQSFVHWNDNRAIIVQNDQIVNGLVSSLQHNKQLNYKINFIQGQLKNYQADSNSCRIQLSTGQKLQTQLLVGSDGNQSKVKQLSQISTYGWNYNQHAIVCTLKISQEYYHNDNNKTGYQIYYQGNVLAILPLWQNYVSIVWSLSLPQFQHIMNKNDEQFLKSLNSVISNSNHNLSHKQKYKHIPMITQIINKRLSFPLSSLQAGNYTTNRIALIGDAAHSIHPMAGLGVNSGIIDSVILANNIIKNKKTGNDIGQSMALSLFQSKSKAFNYSNSIAMETIKKTFEISNPIFNTFRSIGMGIFTENQFIKNQVKNLVDHNPLVDIKPFQWEKNYQ